MIKTINNRNHVANRLLYDNELMFSWCKFSLLVIPTKNNYVIQNGVVSFYVGG